MHICMTDVRHWVRHKGGQGFRPRLYISVGERFAGMVSVAIQLHDDREFYAPGETIAGDLVMTAKDRQKLVKVAVQLEGRLWANRRVFMHRTANKLGENEIERGIEGDFGANFGECADKDVFPGDGATRCRARQPANYNERDLFVHLWTAETVVASNLDVAAGLRRFPFELTVPSKEIVPAFKHIDISVTYSLQGAIKTPVPMMSWFTWTSRSSAVPIELTMPLTARERHAMNDKVSDEETVQVGEWDETSSTAGALLKYAVGGDTARAWHPLTARLTVPSLVCTAEDSPHYLQTGARLTVTPTAPLNVDIAARRLTVKVLTVVSVTEKPDPGMLEFKTKILDEKAPNFVIPKDAPLEPVDVTPLLSAAKIPTELLPSVDTQHVRVQHMLEVRLRLKAQPPHAVKQTSCDVALTVPLRVGRNMIEGHEIVDSEPLIHL